MKNWQKLHQQPQLFERFWVREKVNTAIRQYFKSELFHEVETPSLARSPGTEPFLEVFATQLKQADGTPTGRLTDAFLLTSPEYAMKKLLVAGSGPIFQICKSFRNGEGISGRHNPEFTILEWYRPNNDYTSIMMDCEKMLQHIWKVTRLASVASAKKAAREKGASLAEVEATAVDGEEQLYKLHYQGKNYDLRSPWPRISVAEAFQKYCDVDTETLLSEEKLKAAAKKKGYQVTAQTTWEEVYNQLLLNEIEPHLGQDKPTILYDYPASQAALSRPKASDPRFAERFEFFLAGLELGNAFSELTDAAEQEQRFRSELAERARLGKTPYDLDQDYIDALKVGLPPTGGIAVGVDRLVMLFADTADLAEVTFFPVEDVFGQG